MQATSKATEGDNTMRYHKITYHDEPSNPGWLLIVDDDIDSRELLATVDVPMDLTDPNASDEELLAEARDFFGDLRNHKIEIER